MYLYWFWFRFWFGYRNWNRNTLSLLSQGRPPPVVEHETNVSSMSLKIIFQVWIAETMPAMQRLLNRPITCTIRSDTHEWLWYSLDNIAWFGGLQTYQYKVRRVTTRICINRLRNRRLYTIHNKINSILYKSIITPVAALPHIFAHLTL